MKLKNGEGNNLLMHPHQKVWNDSLVGWIRGNIPTRILRSLSIHFLIFIDTCLLWLQVIIRRFRLFGFIRQKSLIEKARENKIVYLDLGLHKRAEELRWVQKNVFEELELTYEMYGFEASPSAFEAVSEILHAYDNLELVNKALVYEVPEGGKLELHITKNDGLGSSLYKKSDGHVEEVDCIKLSEWLSNKKFDDVSDVFIVRMNIEGAEYDVIKDLVGSPFSKKVAGFYGMWDDVGKIDPDKDLSFRKMLKVNGISPLSFNGRDMKRKWRLRLVRYDFITTMAIGAA